MALCEKKKQLDQERIRGKQETLRDHLETDSTVCSHICTCNKPYIQYKVLRFSFVKTYYLLFVILHSCITVCYIHLQMLIIAAIINAISLYLITGTES